MIDRGHPVEETLRPLLNRVFSTSGIPADGIIKAGNIRPDALRFLDAVIDEIADRVVERMKDV